MVSQQKGFLFAIFASSVVLSAIFILSFIAFVFKLGFTKPDPLLLNSNYSIYNFESELNQTLQNAQGRYLATSNPGWQGYLNTHLVQQLLIDEGKYLKSFSNLLHDYQIIIFNFFGANTRRNTNSYANSHLNMKHNKYPKHDFDNTDITSG